MLRFFYPPPFIYVLLLCLAAPLWAEPARAEPARAEPLRAPSFSQCQALASPKTSPAEKTQLTQLFKTNNLFCSMASAPFPVQHVFSNGQGKSQLRLMMGKQNRYEVDGKSLFDVLLPDRTAIPPAQMVMLAGQVISMLGDMFSSDMSAHTVIHAGGKAKMLVAVLGVNARAALQQLAVLRVQTRLGENDIEPSFWLTRLSRLEAPPATEPQGAAPIATGPLWMQKLMGAGKNLLGTFQGGGE